MGPLPLLLGGTCALLRAVARRQCIRLYTTVCVGSELHPKWGADGGGGVEAQDIGLSYGWGLLLLGILRDGDKFGTVEEGPSHTITQYPVPPPPLLRLRPILDEVLTQHKQ